MQLTFSYETETVIEWINERILDGNSMVQMEQNHRKISQGGIQINFR